MGQRLARRLCLKCKDPYEPTPDQHGGIEFKCDLIYRPKGCQHCKNTGYKGRAIVAEVLVVDNDIRALISKKETTAEQIKDCARKNGMLTLFDSGIKLVEQGITSFEEVGRISVEN